MESRRPHIFRSYAPFDVGREVEPMWVKPDFEVIEVCAEVTSYAYQK